MAAVERIAPCPHRLSTSPAQDRRYANEARFEGRAQDRISSLRLCL
jgi:hypothetical protein